MYTTECAESKECHPAKHHYDECVERVTGQIENDGKASEDCVEECKPTPHTRRSTAADASSFPPCSLRNPMRRTQSLRPAQVEIASIAIDRNIPYPHTTDTDGTLLELKDMTRCILDDCKYRSHV